MDAEFVTDGEQALEQIETHKFDKVFACGPVPMLKELLYICKSHNIPLDISLEEYMACGVGVCYGCAVKVLTEDEQEVYVRVCKEGPVFDGYRVVL